MVDDELSVRLSPPPRGLPLTLTIRTVLGGFTSQFGWAFVAFGMIFVWAFDPGAGLTELVRFSGGLATSEGTSVGWRELNLRVNETTVYETSYVFEVAGEAISGVSYQTGGYVAEGQPVVVEYRSSDPSVSRITGMRASAGGLMVALVYIFPLIGAVMALFGVRKGLRARNLMRTGRLALGVLKSKEATNTKINDQPVYRLTFEFEAEGGGTYRAEAKTHLPQKLQDEARERLVYDPRYPGEATLLDELPCRPRINSRGDFEASGGNDRVLALANLVLPTFTLVGHSLFMLAQR